MIHANAQRLGRTLVVASMLASTGYAHAQGTAADPTWQRLRGIADALIDWTVPAYSDYGAIPLRLIDAARAAKSSPACALAIDAAASYGGYLYNSDEVLQRLEAFSSEDPHPLGAQSARVLRTKILDSLGRHEAAKAVDAYAGYARRVLVVGPLGDAGRDFTGLALPPEFGFPSLDSKLPGRSGQVSPRVFTRRPHEPNLRFHRRGAPHTEGCYYLLHQVRAKTATSAYAELSIAGSCGLFVNGESVHSRYAPATRDSGRVFVPIQLRAGVNHVLIKSASTGTKSATLRYVDARGKSLDELTELEPSERPALAAAGAADAPPALGPFLDDCSSMRHAAQKAADSAGPEDAQTMSIAAMLACLQRDQIAAQLELLAQFDDTEPASAQLALGLAAVVDRTRTLPSELRSSRVRELIEQAERDPSTEQHHYATIRRARLLADQDKVEDAIRLLDQRLEAFPSESPTYATQRRFLRQLRLHAAEQQLLDDWLATNPHDPRPRIAIARDRNRHGAPRAALDLLLAGLELQPGSARLQRPIRDLATALGDRKLAEEMLRRLHIREPDSASAARARADLDLALGDTAAATRSLVTAIRHADATASTIASDASEAIAIASETARNGVLEAVATRVGVGGDRGAEPNLRRLLARARGDDEFPWFDRFRRDALAAVNAFEPGEREQGAATTLLIDQTIAQFYPDGSWVQETHVLRRINDLRGVEQFEEAAELGSADEVMVVRTIDEDGASFVPTRVQGSYSMPRARPGVFFEQRFRNEHAAPNSGRITSGPAFFFQSALEPYGVSEYVLILPKNIDDFGAELRTRRFDATTERVELPDGYVAHVYRATDVPRLPTESRAPALGDLVAGVGFGADRTLGSQARGSYASVRSLTRPSPWVTTQTRSILAEPEQPAGDLARAEALYDWVHREIPEGSGAPDATSVLLRRRGPRFFLWLAMLEAAGVPFDFAVSEIVVDAMRSDGEPLFQGESNVVVECARIRPRDHAAFWAFADAARYEPMAAGISFERRGAAVILLRDGGHELARLPSSPLEARAAFEAGLVIDPDSDSAKLSTVVHVLGQGGYYMADQVREIPARHHKLVSQQIIGSMVPGWTIVESQIETIEPGERLALSAELERRGALQPTGGPNQEAFLPLPIPPLELTASLADLSTRTLPLLVTEPNGDDWVVTLDPGPNRRFVGLPDSCLYESQLLDFSLQFTRAGPAGRKIRVERRWRQRPGRVEPSNYADWRRLLERIDSASRASLTLVGG